MLQRALSTLCNDQELQKRGALYAPSNLGYLAQNLRYQTLNVSLSKSPLPISRSTTASHLHTNARMRDATPPLPIPVMHVVHIKIYNDSQSQTYNSECHVCHVMYVFICCPSADADV